MASTYSNKAGVLGLGPHDQIGSFNAQGKFVPYIDHRGTYVPDSPAWMALPIIFAPGQALPAGAKIFGGDYTPAPKPAPPKLTPTKAAAANTGGTVSGGNTVATIVAFLQGKGLSSPAIAGILGNMQTESGFSTTALNAGEGAIGLVQWEGGRRTALQNYARSVGKTESDLGVQLNFMWQELSGSYSGALNAIRSATSATAAATAWDAQYEVSAGTTRADRIANANAWLSSNFQSGGNGVTASGSGAGGSVTSSGGGAGGGAPGTPGNVAADYKTALGSLSGLLTSIPELKHLLDTAISTNQPVNDFLNSVQNSQYYKTHAASVRSYVALSVSDPAELLAQRGQYGDQVKTQAAQLGVTLTHDQVGELATKAIMLGRQTDLPWMTQQIFGMHSMQATADPSKLQGGMAATAQQLQALAGQYGQDWGGAQYSYRAQQILEGRTTIDTYKQLLMNQAKSMYPGLTDQIDKGVTVADAASPYVQSMSGLLEMDPAKVDLNTPLIKKALQGTAGVGAAGASNPTLTPLWQFEDQVRADPRWGFTNNAHAAMASQTMQIGRNFGFET